MKVIGVIKSTDHKHKYVAIVEDDDGRRHHIRFGAWGMSDYTLHKDDGRKSLYDSRHSKNEDWGKSGRLTAGFWAKHYLWEYKSKTEALSEIKRKYFND
jgi:Family of unknown function (DUF5754)